MMNGFTPVEARIIETLSDGLPHKVKDLVACLWDSEQGSDITVRVHVKNIRKKLPLNQAIICEAKEGARYYRHVRIVKLISKLKK